MLALKGYQVSIVAAQTHTTSHNAAGFFFPRPRKRSTPEECALFLSFGIESYRTYQQIINNSHPFLTKGAQLLPCYFGLDIDPGFDSYTAQNIMDPPEQVSIDFQNGKVYDVVEYKTIFIDVVALMSELERNRQELGIEIER